MSRSLPSFDLVVATVGRTDVLAHFLDSLEAQGDVQARVIVVDQNDDDRVGAVLATRRSELIHLRATRGLSRARNVGLRELSSDLVAFPDDDCVYPPGLLDRIGERLAADPELDGIAGRVEDAGGHSSGSWKRDPTTLTDDNLWNRANAATIFLRRELVERVGEFDEQLGLGSGKPWSSGEETDYLIRAVRAGARIAYDPSLVVRHDVRVDDARIGLRDGASVGYLLRKHRYPAKVVARMFLRPVGGAALAAVHLDSQRARYYLATVRGRARGYAGASRSNS